MLSLSIFSWKNLFGFDLPFLPFCGNKIKSKKQKSLIWIFIVFGKQFYFRSFNLGAGEREGEEKGSQELFRQKSLKMESMFFVLLEPHVIHVKYHISRILCDMSHICGIFDISHITLIIWYFTGGEIGWDQFMGMRKRLVEPGHSRQLFCDSITHISVPS